MSKLRSVFLLTFLVLIVIIISHSGRDITFYTLYAGDEFEIKMVYLLLSFAIFLSYSVFISFDAQEYLQEYGCYVLIRKKNRIHIFSHLIKHLFQQLLLLEFVKLTAWILLGLLYYHRCDFSIQGIFILIVISILTDCIFFVLQMNLEIYLTGQVSLTITLGLFLFLLSLGNIFYAFYNESNHILAVQLNSFILPNYIFISRSKEIIQITHISPFLICGILLSLLLVELLGFRQLFKRKNFI